MMAIFYAFFNIYSVSQVVMEGNNLEKVYRVFPMECLPEEYLPDDYDGPNAGSIDEITGRFTR